MSVELRDLAWAKVGEARPADAARVPDRAEAADADRARDAREDQ
ncbi:hypothetical protein [Actinokineospora sp. HUAS TT18]